MESLAKLIGDGAQCYEAYKTLTAEEGASDTTLIDQVLAYAPYPFMAIEKYYKLSDSYEILQVDYRHLAIDINGFFYVYEPLMQKSYIQYARSVSRGLADNIWPKVGGFAEEMRLFYNIMLEDIPVAENYQLSQLELKNILNVAYNHWGFVIDGITALDQMGIDQIEQILRKSKNMPTTTTTTSKPFTTSLIDTTNDKRGFWPNVTSKIKSSQANTKQWWVNLVNQIQNRRN